MSLIRAQKAEAMFRRLFGTAQIEQLALDFYCVSAEMLQARVVVHDRGPLAEAVGASMSIPGLVPPLREAGRLLVDGGVLNNLPIGRHGRSGRGTGGGRGRHGSQARGRRDAADAPGDPGPVARRHPPGHALPTILETLSRATVLGSWRTAEENRILAAAVISPELGGIGLFEFGRLDAAVEAGRKAAQEALPTLAALV